MGSMRDLLPRRLRASRGALAAGAPFLALLGYGWGLTTGLGAALALAAGASLLGRGAPQGDPRAEARQRVSRWALAVVSTALASIFADEPLFVALVLYALAALTAWVLAVRKINQNMAPGDPAVVTTPWVVGAVVVSAMAGLSTHSTQSDDRMMRIEDRRLIVQREPPTAVRARAAPSRRWQRSARVPVEGVTAWRLCDRWQGCLGVYGARTVVVDDATGAVLEGPSLMRRITALDRSRLAEARLLLSNGWAWVRPAEVTDCGDLLRVRRVLSEVYFQGRGEEILLDLRDGAIFERGAWPKACDALRAARAELGAGDDLLRVP